MRAPLGRLVEGARRLAGGDLRTRVEVGGPVEIATLGRAFNEMANSLERDARERDRVEQMKDDFVLTVSHELRTPVTVVKGFAEMLTAQRKSLNSRQFEAAEVIAESAGQLQKMINDLLDLARSDAGKLRIEPEPTAVRPLAQRIGRQMRPALRGARASDFTVSVEKDLPDVEADAVRIGQVLANLLTNANKYCPGGRPGDARGDPGRATRSSSRSRTRARASRRSSSTTSSTASGARRAARPSPGGTGLGLAIAKSLVELHGGAISANSTPGEGATFRFVLPIAKDGRPTPTATREQDKGGGCRVTQLLVADDSETVLLMLQRRLEMEGYDVVTATDGVEALERLRELAPKEPDIILLDAMMPNMSGTEVLEEIRGKGSKVPDRDDLGPPRRAGARSDALARRHRLHPEAVRVGGPDREDRGAHRPR